MSTTKIDGNKTNISNSIFQNKFTFWHIRLSIYIWKTKFSSHKKYFFGLLFLRNAKKTHTDQSILQSFLFCFSRSILQTFKSSRAAKKPDPSVFIIDISCFDECFLFHVITVNSISCANVLLTRSLLLPPSLKQVFWKSPHFMSVISKITLQW